jgi:hypothetical protein
LAFRAIDLAVVPPAEGAASYLVWRQQWPGAPTKNGRPYAAVVAAAIAAIAASMLEPAMPLP